MLKGSQILYSFINFPSVIEVLTKSCIPGVDGISLVHLRVPVYVAEDPGLSLVEPRFSFLRDHFFFSFFSCPFFSYPSLFNTTIKFTDRIRIGSSRHNDTLCLYTIPDRLRTPGPQSDVMCYSEKVSRRVVGPVW